MTREEMRNLELQTLKMYSECPPTHCCTCFWYGGIESISDNKDYCLYDGVSIHDRHSDMLCNTTIFLKRYLERI